MGASCPDSPRLAGQQLRGEHDGFSQTAWRAGVDSSEHATRAGNGVHRWEHPARNHLDWPGNSFAVSTTVSRKLLGEQGWTPLSTLPGLATAFTDGSIVPGITSIGRATASR